MINSADLPEITGGKFLQYAQDLTVTFLTTDSRKCVFSNATLFFAIKGNIHDGHNYISALYKKNIRQFVIEDPDFLLTSFPEANFILCYDTIHALQNLAAWHRKKFSFPVIGITGSNGKTIVKEWLSQLLGWKYNVVKTPKSYNSQIGVALSLWQINNYHSMGIFEAGISRKNEMQRLQKMIAPDLGILTNIGPAHDEGFSSRQEKLQEKLQLFAHSDTLIYRNDDPMIENSVKEYLINVRKISWGSGVNAEYRIKSILTTDPGTSVNILNGPRQFDFTFGFSDKASVENMIHCIICLLYMQWDQAAIQEEINALSKISMRLEMKKGINNCYIIDDSYSNDLAGLEIALNYLNNQHHRQNKSLIITDILQSGIDKEILYKKTAELLSGFNLSRIIGIGTDVQSMAKYIHHDFRHFPDTGAFMSEFNLDAFKNETILIKGARKYSLEKVVTYLQEKIHGTVLEINLDALSYNLNIYRSYLAPDTKLMVMVKALAYGSGSIEVANLLEFHRVDYLGVAYTDEGVTLRKNGISLPIMVMNPSSEAFDMILAFRLEPEIYNLRILRELDSYSRVKEKQVKIHIKIDTGMHRLGFSENDLDEMTGIIMENPYLKVVSIFSHLAAADEEIHDDFTHDQAKRFISACRMIREKSGIDFIRHIANSAAITRFPQYHFDMVRLGIGLYGSDATGMLPEKLRPIGRLKTNISQINHLPAGNSVGYGRKGKLKKNSTIATIAIGYADGFSRTFSNGIGKVFINGSFAPVIGNVCMDMTMVDITGIEAREGDEVLIFGEEITLQELAGTIHTIPYEILTSISERVKRIYISE